MSQTLSPGLDLNALKRLLNRWDELRRGAVEITDSDRWAELWIAAPRPYPGLRSFSPEEDDLFFARDEQVQGLMDQLGNSRIIVVLGGSGSGKSSLLRAGLIPRLSGGAEVPGRDGRWYVVDFRPGEDPNTSLLRGLCEALFAPALGLIQHRTSDPPALGRQAVTKALGIEETQEPHEILAKANHILKDRLFPNAGQDLRAAELDVQALFGFAQNTMDVFDCALCGGLRVGKPNLLLLLDQFEEAFRPEVEPQALRNLCKLLKDLFSIQPAGFFLAATMRSEEEHRATEIGLANIMTCTAYHLGPLDEERDRDAIIIEPARAVLDNWLPGWRETIPNENRGTAPYRRELIAQLTKESRHVLDGPGNRSDHLPLLQHALLRIWDVAAARWKREAEQPGGAVDLLIGPADFEAACGTESLTLDGCLNFHANAALKSAQAAARSHLGNGPDADQRAERMLLVALCTIARRDDRNNWARRFTSAPRIAALIGDGCPDNEKAAREALETLRLSGYLNDIRRGSVGIHDLASEAPNTDAKLFDVSHEALIRRWRKLRDEVLPAAEELAESLNEVERNLSEITRLEAAGESCQTIVQPLPIWKFLGSPAATIRKFWPHFAEAVRTMPSHVAGWWRHVSEISRTKGCGRPAVILRQLDDASVRFWAWINETPEKLATATVPDRVRGSLSSILGDNARFPRPLGAALLADMIERNQGLTGDDSRLAVEAKRRELEHRLLRRIEKMEAPWRTASRYSRRTVNRPMKFLTGALIFLLILMLAVVNITTHAEFTEEQRKNADFNASAAQVMALAANIGSVVEQGLAIEVAAFELQRALDKVIELEETLTSRSNDAIDRDPTAEVLITLDEKSRLDIGIPQFEHSSQALDQWIRSLIGRVTLRVLNEPPPPRGDQACVALNGSDGKPIPISRTVGGRPFGLSFDPRTSTWTTITPAKQGAGPVEAEVIDKQNAPLPAKGLVCLSTDASVAMTWETGGEGTNGGQMNDLPKFWALPWACKVSVNGSCQKWTVRVQDLRSPLLSDPDLFAPAMFNETFRAARDAVLEDRSGPEGIFLLKSTQDLPRTGFELAFGSPDKRLVADFGDGLAAPPIVDAPTNSEIVHTCVKRVPGRDCREACVGNVPARDCREVSLGPWRIRWAERPFDKPKTDPDGCPDASCQAFVTIYNQKGFRLGEVQLTSGRIDAFSVDGSALLIGDEHGIWRRIVVERPELRKHLDALNPSPSSGQTARQQLTPLCQTYNCKDWNKSLSATTQ